MIKWNTANIPVFTIKILQLSPKFPTRDNEAVWSDSAIIVDTTGKKVWRAGGKVMVMVQFF